MEVDSNGWKVYTLEPELKEQLVKKKEKSVEFELDISDKNPIYWFRNKADIFASIKQLVEFGSTRYQAFMTRADAIEIKHRESSTKLTDLNNDMLVDIMNRVSPEEWANLMTAAIERIPKDKQKPIFDPVQNKYYTPTAKSNNNLWEANDDTMIRKKCDEFLENNDQYDKDFCLSSEPINLMCRDRSNRCTTTIWDFAQKEVIPIPNQPGAYRIKEGVDNIVHGAFSFNEELKSIVMPNSVTTIGDSAFRYCTELEFIEIPNSVTTIEVKTFQGCTKLESIEIPNSVTTIEAAAFRGCAKLESIEIPNSVTTIGPQAFRGCTKLEFIKIPNSVTSIEAGAFRDCTKLQFIEIPNSVTSIGEYAFSLCPNLKTVIIPESVVKIQIAAFSGSPSLDAATLARIREVRHL